MDLKSRIEALLFVSSTSVSILQLANSLHASPHKIESAVEELSSEYKDRGIRLQQFNRGLQLTSAPEAAKDIQLFLELEETSRLSRAALEVLAIVAYQQPVTRPHIDSIRGVNSDSVLRNLLRHGLIAEVGRSDGPGRPILYATTSEFMSHFGLGSLEELPPLNLDAGSDIPDPMMNGTGSSDNPTAS